MQIQVLDRISDYNIYKCIYKIYVAVTWVFL